MTTMVVLVTVPDRETGLRIARHLVERRVAACVNVVGGVRSVYWWEGKVEESDEALLIIKTSSDRVNDVVRSVREVHPYQLPEILAVPAVAGLKEYMDWVFAETHK